ncbi:MAG TPA: tetratricopeptide repeat protein [Candidatus Udaeobacter sp.]|nr:tetratricopeptide repeat protein [Candidatus Udaeobacter sp.]
MATASSGDTLRLRRDDSLAVLTVGLFLVIIVWTVFGQTIRHGFINYDDGTYVYQNRDVLAGVTLRGIRWAFTFAEIGHWHPVTWFSHMLDASVWGRRAGGHHLTNVLLHIASAFLLFLALKQMTGALWRSAAVAAFFAIHPQRVESVAWISERKDVLSGLFFMATILAYVRYTARPSLGRYAVVVILFALGLMSKSMLVTLPLVLLVLDYWPLARFGHVEGKQPARNLPRLVGEKIPLLVLSVASCVMTSLSPEKITPVFQASLISRMENAIVSYVIYIKQMFYPVGLELPYFNPPGGFPPWEVIACVLLLLGISGAAFLYRERRPYFIVGWLWYLVMMLPVIGLVQISYYARADRYTYLPHIGLYLLIVWGAVDLTRAWAWRRGVLTFAGLVVIALLVMQARVQASYWHDSERLWRYVLAIAPDNFVAHVNLGLVLDAKGQVDAAIAEYEKAERIQPGYAEEHNDLGNALCRAGRVTEAIAQYEKALELVPGLPQIHNNLGTALAQNGQTTEAIAQFRKVIEINPNFAGAHGNLGYALAIEGKLDEALSELQKAAELKPDSTDIHLHLGDVFLARGQTADAIVHYKKAVELSPNNAQARRKLVDATAGSRH